METQGTATSRWPDFFIVGAGRTGTTSLYYYLRGHPNIYMPSVKEPHFFSQDRGRTPAAERRLQKHSAAREIKTEKDYLKLFQAACPDQVAGEASTTYLSSSVSARRIAERNPRARIIAVLREPIERAYSQYLLDIREGTISADGFYEAVLEDFQYVENEDGSSFYIWPGLFYRHVKTYLDIFGAEQVRVYLQEDLESDGFAVVKDICSFLGVPFHDGSFFDPSRKYHTYGPPSNALFRWALRTRWLRALAASVAPMHLLLPVRDRLVSRERPKPPLDPRAREFLSSIYRDDILKLQELIRRDLSGWLKASPG